VAEVILDLAIESLVRGGQQVLRDIRWTVRRGEHWAIVGPNGAGKTSLLQILAGYLWPSRGSVVVLGARFGETDLRALRKAIGVVSSALDALQPVDLDAATVVASGFEASIGMPWNGVTSEQRAAADRALSAVGAAQLASRELGTLSQGERQRVLIARALVHEPALIVLDEPCAGLDPVARERLLADLAVLAAHRSAPAVVLVTHHLEEIPPFVGHALVLAEGRRIASGPTALALTSATMTEAFGVTCDVRPDGRGRRFLVVRLP